MYCSGFNSAFVEERPDSVPSHSSGAVSSLPRGHHTCRLLHKQLTHRDMPHSSGERRDHSAGKCGKGGSEVDRREEERDQRWMEERKRGIGGRRRRGNEGLGKVEKRGIRCGGHGLVASRVQERIRDLSAQEKEKIDHVWMGVWTNGIRRMKVWEKCTEIMKGK